MAKVQDVANFFIGLGQSQMEKRLGDAVTPLKLEKLLYFAQGRFLGRFGRPLFDEDFEAWDYGPVIPEIYKEYKVFGANGIVRANEDRTENGFTPEESDFLMDVAVEYMDYSAGKLVSMTHEPNTPWSNTRYGEIISKDSMRAYFAALEPLETFDDVLDGYPTEVL